MSSGKFEIRLKPDPRLRRLLYVFATGSLLAGTLLILRLPLQVPVRTLLLSGWLVSCGRELSARVTAAARVHAIGIDSDGRVYVRDAEDREADVRLLAGSVVGERLAWLRLGFDDGSHYGELLTGNHRNPDWRRLQVFWSHAGSQAS